MLSHGWSVDNNSALKISILSSGVFNQSRGKCSHQRPYVQIIPLNISKWKLYNTTNITDFMILILNFRSASIIKIIGTFTHWEVIMREIRTYILVERTRLLG